MFSTTTADLPTHSKRGGTESLLACQGKPSAQVSLITSPRIQGHSQMKQRACDVLSRWSPVADVVVLLWTSTVKTDRTAGRGGRRASPMFLDTVLPVQRRPFWYWR